MSSGVLGDIKQQVGDLGKQLGQSIANAPKAAVKTAVSQVGFEIKDKEGKKEVPQGAIQAEAKQKPQAFDEQAKKANADFVKDLYGPTPQPEVQQQKPKNPQEAAGIETAEKLAKENPNKSPEEISQMASVKQQLKQQQHSETYYQPLTSPEKRPEEAQEEQERAEERMERLGMEDLQEKKKKEEKMNANDIPEAKKTEAPLGAG